MRTLRTCRTWIAALLLLASSGLLWADQDPIAAVLATTAATSSDAPALNASAKTIMGDMGGSTGNTGASAGSSTSNSDSLGSFISDNQLIGRLGSKATSLVNTSMGFLGMPYRLGGNGAQDGGIDCSGFVRAVYEKTLGKLLPRRASEQAEATRTIAKDQLQPGDLVFFNTMHRAFSHVGIYIGNNQFIHSPRTGGAVRIESMDIAYWKNRFDGARRVDTTQNDSADIK